ncbi:hypothetical protein GCM10027275_11590 [Rhabdobacter roseus]|uniref:Uncharacterized protein n=1 Tax=Rhabdobacter roseus TaxID=1655419 RepID=A0A840TIC4_9BACT|nr:DUF6624 domain-containing protein [Rhabdobacter roseus]MBB5283071.1 hypothetical protein [Rhabdobacter roseus]
MKYLIILFLFTVPCAYGQQVANPRLKAQLDSVMVLDQKYRELLMNINTYDSLQTDSLARSMQVPPGELFGHLWDLQSTLDSTNLVFIEQVFLQYGYPGKSLVGEGTNEAAWYVIQHSEKIDQYFGQIEKAGKQKELPYRLVAMMQDRQLMYQGQEQIYGTQGACRPLRDQTGTSCFIWPIDNPKKVNKRRKKAGFDLTVEQNAKRLNIDYKPLTMNEVRAQYDLDL